MKKFLIVILGLWIGFVIFLPKENLYFTAQKYLKKENIFINGNTSENIINLNIKNVTIFINGMDLVKINHLKITLLLIFNKIDVNKLIISGINFGSNNIEIYYTLLYPTKVFIKGDKINGAINLKDRNLKIYIKHPSTNLKSMLKKDKEGYYYAQKF